MGRAERAVPLKVLYILHNAAPGGAGRSLLHLVRALPAGRVQPMALMPPGPAVSAYQAAGVPVRLIEPPAIVQSITGAPLRGRRLVLEVARALSAARHGGVLRRAMLEAAPDIVHLNDRGLLHAAGIARGLGIPVVLHVRCVADRASPWIGRRLDAWTRRVADRVVAIDESVRHSVRELADVTVIYNPVGSEDLAPALAVPPRTPGLVQVTLLGNLLPYKGVWDLLEAARLLRDRDDVRVVLAGGNSRPAAFYRSVPGRLARLAGFAPDMERAVAAWIRREGLGHRVEALGHVDDIAPVLDATDILVFPSHLNGPGRSVFEAGVRGIPSVVALRDRIEDIVVDGVTGLVVPERDPRALAAAIARLADDEALRRRMGEESRRRYRSQFAPGPIGERMFALYSALVGPGR